MALVVGAGVLIDDIKKKKKEKNEKNKARRSPQFSKR